MGYGLLVSFFSGSWLNMFISATGMELLPVERNDMVITFTTICHLVITMGFYFSTMLFYKEGKNPERDKERDSLFHDFKTPVVAEMTTELLEKYRFQRQVLGIVSLSAGCIIGLLTFVPGSEMTSRIVVFLTSVILVVIGVLLRKSRKKAE